MCPSFRYEFETIPLLKLTNKIERNTKYIYYKRNLYILTIVNNQKGDFHIP